jgi:hypothetical protein
MSPRVRSLGISLASVTPRHGPLRTARGATQRGFCQEHASGPTRGQLRFLPLRQSCRAPVLANQRTQTMAVTAPAELISSWGSGSCRCCTLDNRLGRIGRQYQPTPSGLCGAYAALGSAGRLSDAKVDQVGDVPTVGFSWSRMPNTSFSSAAKVASKRADAGPLEHDHHPLHRRHSMISCIWCRRLVTP